MSGRRLSAADARIVMQEEGALHAHIGAVLIFDGPPPEYKDFAEHVASRLRLVPRYRQRLAFPRFDPTRPVWVDDPGFNIEYHVRHSALPEPGGHDELERLCGRVFSQQLDRSKPLWELWLVEGLEDGRFAIINKTHQVVVDGQTSVDLVTVLFDLSSELAERIAGFDEWDPAPEPAEAAMYVEGVREAAVAPVHLAGRAIDAALNPGRSARSLLGAVERRGRRFWQGGDEVPHTPLNVQIGSHRRYTWVRTPLSDFQRAKDELGGTVNDVVLAVVAGALGRWLHSRGIPTEGLELKAGVPVSVRDETTEHGGRIELVVVPLPVYADGPVDRLRVVREATKDLKRSHSAVGAEMITELENFAPPTMLAEASRLPIERGTCNVAVINVPGPQIELSLLGRRLSELAPVGRLSEGFALSVAAMSYDGCLEFGLLADLDALPDIDDIAAFLATELEALRAAAAAGRAAF